MIKGFSPQTALKFRRFKKIRRGYLSLVILSVMILMSIFAEVFVNSRALVVSYEGKLYFPVYGRMIPGTELGLSYDYETNYRDLDVIFRMSGSGNWLIMPPVPWNPYENDLKDGKYPPFAPSIKSGHYFGTDVTGRDILARLVYGFRIAMGFSVCLLLITYVVGIVVGCLMGYRGGFFDLFFQRVIEIWSNVPFLYVIIIVASVITPGFFMLVIIMALFSWMSMTWVMRTMAYREKEREYVMAARSLGASDFRIIIRHIIPNTLSVIVTYAPFSISGGIVALTSLDYLGFGLQPPTPSWGELLDQGWANMDSWWISMSVIAAMIITLTAVTFVGEAVREAFDPRKHTVYE